MVIGARLTYTDPPTPVLVLKGVRAPPWHTPCTFAPESNQILAISSLPLLRPLSLSLSLRDLPPTLAGKRCPFECTIPLPATIYRAEDIMGLGFQGKENSVTRRYDAFLHLLISLLLNICTYSKLQTVG